MEITACIERMEQIETQKRFMKKRVHRLILADNLKPVELDKANKDGFVKWEEGVFISDVTSKHQILLGMTILHVLVTKDYELQTHEHSTQSQSLFVQKGHIYDIGRQKNYQKGDSLFIDKNENHKLRYYANSEYYITFQPNLERI